jgi:transposase
LAGDFFPSQSKKATLLAERHVELLPLPRQHSSGGKQKLLGITKRGNSYQRMLLVHSARAVVHQEAHRQDPLPQWINKVRERREINVAVAALANKTARTLWAMLTRDEDYRLSA